MHRDSADVEEIEAVGEMIGRYPPEAAREPIRWRDGCDDSAVPEWLRGLTREIIGTDADPIGMGDPVDWIGGWRLTWFDGSIVPYGEANVWESEPPELRPQIGWLVNPAICQALNELIGFGWHATYPVEPD